MYENFDIRKGDVVTITGAGGKTSLMIALARELAQYGRVLVTTTTKIYKPAFDIFEELILDDSIIRGTGNNIFVAGSKIVEDKLHGLSYDKISLFKESFDYILIEGDGAKEKLLKEWNENEPCIPPASNKVIGVINMDILNQTLVAENVHRFDIFLNKFSNYISKTVSKEFLVEYILKADYFKNSGYDSKYLFFNGIDGSNYMEKFSLAIDTCNELTKLKFAPKLILGSVTDGKCYPFVPVSAIVMASGFSKRMGEDKIKLKYNGVSLLENVLDKLRFSNFYEIIVCGRNTWTRDIAHKYGCVYLENTKAELGQSESIKLGVANARGKGYAFFTADQVLLTTGTIKRLMFNFEKYGYITIPASCGERYSPVFFPHNKKNELLALKGDIGGREIIRNTSLISLVEFPYAHEFKDIDTPDDYAMIVEK